MHRTYCKVVLPHFVGQPVNLYYYIDVNTLFLVLTNMTAYVIVRVS